MNNKIRVGIIGANPDRGWAMRAHIPALKSLPDFEITALSTSRRESAEAAGKLFDVPLVFDNHHDLVSNPNVDVVAVTVKVPYHLELATAALNAGKAVYCEWPLGNGLCEAEQLAELARTKGVLAVVGMQARFSPAFAYVRDLVRQGYVGEVLSATLIGNGMNWGPVMEQANAYTGDISNGATLLSIPFGHTVDALCYCLGEIRELSATLAVRRKTFTVAETGAVMPMTSPDQVCVDGLLDNGAPISIHYRGGVSRGINMLCEISGSEGELQLTALGGHAQTFDIMVHGGRGADTGLQVLPIPDEYYWAPSQSMPSINIAQAYMRFADDYRKGTHHCPTFDDAVKRHRMLQAIETAAASGQRQSLA